MAMKDYDGYPKTQSVFRCGWCGRLYVAQSSGEPGVWRTSHICKEMMPYGAFAQPEEEEVDEPV